MAQRKECSTCKHKEKTAKQKPCFGCWNHNMSTFTNWESDTIYPPDELDKEAQYDWEKEFYRRMEINGYKRAEYIPEISDSVELFREFIQLGYFATPPLNKR